MKRLPHFSRSRPTCRFSDPAQPHKLSRRSDPPISRCFACKSSFADDEEMEGYYYCATCNLEFHSGCYEFPPEIRHPFHPSHSLTLIFSDTFFCSEFPRLWVDNIFFNETPSTIHGDDIDVADGSYVKCKCCRKNLTDQYYHCSICNFSLNCICTTHPPPLTITYRRSHEHILTLFTRRIPLPCDACGFSLDDPMDHVFACLPCDYMVHGTCIYLPRLIKITRHQHRLSFNSMLSPGSFACGVCRKPVDINYGQYSCNKGCLYAIHSKCATRRDVWDGKDLEGTPEEPEEDIEPFVRIDKETIQHFSHHHHLKLHKNLHHEKKFCEACCLPISFSNAFYSCMECIFVLDEECANLPRKKHHPLHKHPLILHSFLSQSNEVEREVFVQGILPCKSCHRIGNGFMYQCGKKSCKFQIDVRCGSLPDTLIHGSHPQDHSLFLNLTEGECTRCESSNCSSYFLECMKCKSFLGLKCATLPSLAYYKHDKHLLTLCYGEKTTKDVEYWCEICESKLDASRWFYTCDSCRVTLHVTCLLGKDMGMKPNSVIKINDDAIEIVDNDGNSRPFCYVCDKRCVETLVFKGRGRAFCNLSCLMTPWVVGQRPGLKAFQSFLRTK